MVSLVLVLVSIALCGGFLVLTAYESRRGTRFFVGERNEFDARIAHLTFMVTHVDFESFLRHEMRALSARIVHDVVHLSLLTVRAAERLLTRAVKHLRTRHDLTIPRSESNRPFVKAMSDFKQHLSTTRPPIPEI